MKLVINVRPGGFGLSESGVRRYFEIKGWPLWICPGTALTGPQYWLVPPRNHDDGNDEGRSWPGKIDRSDPDLIQTVEELVTAAGGRRAELRVIEIPDGVRWTICEREGGEWVAEIHRTWP